MAEKSETKRTYKKTLNLPKTKFAMKANLVQNEPQSQKRWQKIDLYARIREASKGRPPFVFHDGPPYANGSIHLGHLLNKVLKDMVVRSKSMLGYDCPYVPGWDCHGLPIEHKVMQELGDRARDMNAMQVRTRCHDYARKFVKLQSTQMQRLLTLADYGDPYITMAPTYEGAVLEVFADLIEQGLVYRALKPVHWSIANQTALAEAELEYYDREDTSVYVMFDLADPSRLPGGIDLAGIDRASLMIWTTTPWTLPANMAVAVHEKFEYGIYRIERDGRTDLAIIACDLAARVLEAGGVEPTEPLATCTGADLLGLQYQHPFIDRVSPVVGAEYVTLEDGTGLVHTAPGHGEEDYQTGLREGIDIYCPVRDDGTFDQTAPEWIQGKTVWEANGLVVEHLRRSGHLFFDHAFTHSYPHDWRGKTPVIFRATEQWFVGVDRPAKRDGRSLRDMAMSVTADDITFLPGWGRNRMRGMLESRPDWCISRQRSWGLPIPAFHDEQGRPLLTAASVRAVAQAVREHGSNYWFAAEPADLLASYNPSTDPDAPDWLVDADAIARLKKGADIFDVWFESGSSWNAVMRQRDLAWGPQDDRPWTDLYLEGSDQHRGWFQLSLLPALGATGRSPFATVLTHGFMVDKDGRKMSKSLGNTLEVDDLLKQFGADVCRWWVSSLNTDNDIKVDQEFFRLAGEQYRKVRNTIRFVLSNLADYDSAAEPIELDPTSLDAWAMQELASMIATVRQAYERLNYRGASDAIFTFCNETMSAVYLTAVKDRLYCDTADSPRRRRTQQTLHAIAGGLIRLVAPILPHTADEAWRVLSDDENACVHLELAPHPPKIETDVDFGAVMKLRDNWLRAIEARRQVHEVDNPLDLGLRVPCEHEDLKRLDPTDLADLCGVSQFELTDGNEVEVVDLRDLPRCERSWKRDGTVKERSDGGMLSDRDAAAVGVE